MDLPTFHSAAWPTLADVFTQAFALVGTYDGLVQGPDRTPFFVSQDLGPDGAFTTLFDASGQQDPRSAHARMASAAAAETLESAVARALAAMPSPFRDAGLSPVFGLTATLPNTDPEDLFYGSVEWSQDGYLLPGSWSHFLPDVASFQSFLDRIDLVCAHAAQADRLVWWGVEVNGKEPRHNGRASFLAPKATDKAWKVVDMLAPTRAHLMHGARLHGPAASRGSIPWST